MAGNSMQNATVGILDTSVSDPASRLPGSVQSAPRNQRRFDSDTVLLAAVAAELARLGLRRARNSPEQTRWISVLMLEGYTHSEIADQLGITVRRIKYVLHKRALKMSAARVIDPPKLVQTRPPASKEAT